MRVGDMNRFHILIILLSPIICKSDFESECGDCECKWSGGKKTANCTGMGLRAIPTNLHNDIQVLILDYNNIPFLDRDIFVARTPNLQKIYMKHCGLQRVDENAFRDLKILIEIDLSHNNLTAFGTKTFTGNDRLKTLNLSNNPMSNLISFQFPPLPHIKTMDFSNCLLTRIERTALGNLGESVEAVSLKGNRLRSLQEEVFLSTTGLKSLELHQNPWRCDCHLKNFRDWVVDRGLYNYPTTCSEPERLSDKMWDVIESKEFACKPEINVTQGRVYSTPGSNVTLGCLITGNPMPEAKWVLKGRIVNNNTSPLHSSQLYRIHELGGIERWFNLTLFNIGEEDAADYTCVAVNAGGVSEQNVTITFDQPVTLSDSQEPVKNNGNLFIIFGAVGAGIVLSILFITLFYCCCCRPKTRDKNQSGTSYTGSILGFSDADQQNLIAPRGILKQRDSSYSSAGEVELDRFNHLATRGILKQRDSSYSAGEVELDRWGSSIYNFQAPRGSLKQSQSLYSNADKVELERLYHQNIIVPKAILKQRSSAGEVEHNRLYQENSIAPKGILKQRNSLHYSTGEVNPDRLYHENPVAPKGILKQRSSSHSSAGEGDLDRWILQQRNSSYNSAMDKESPRRILTRRNSSYTSGKDVKEDSYGTSSGYLCNTKAGGSSGLSSENHTLVSQSSLLSDTEHFPDLLDIPNRDQQSSPTGGDAKRGNDKSPPQMLNAASLIKGPPSSSDPLLPLPSSSPPCDHPSCGIPTAAILPPPPNFLGTAGSVQTIPLHPRTVPSGFLTLPRNTRNSWSGVTTPHYDGVGPRTSADGSSLKSSSKSSTPNPDQIPALPPPPEFALPDDHEGKLNRRHSSHGGTTSTNVSDEIHEKLKPILKTKKELQRKPHGILKNVTPKLTENPEDISLPSQLSTIQEVSCDGYKHSYSTLPNPRSRSASIEFHKGGEVERKHGCQV